MISNIYKYIKNLFSKEEVFVEQEDDVVYAQSIQMIDYLLNDPTTPELVLKNYEIPPLKGLKVKVDGLNNPATQKQSLNTLATITRSLNYMQDVISKAKKPLTKWSATDSLNVVPRAGNQFNAYYDRKSLKFYYARHPIDKKIVYLCESADVVAHEQGHAILDAICPDLWAVPNLEIFALHEAFADICSMINAMLSKEMLSHAIKETDGDLSKSNIITRIAEELGGVLNILDNTAAHPNYLRDASIRFNYVNPQSLPKDAPSNKLSRDSHSFSRVFSGAWYELFCKVYNKEMKDGKNALDAAHVSKDICTYYLIKSVIQAPRTKFFFNAIVKTMIAIDKMQGGKYSKEIIDTFSSRKIYTTVIKALSVENLEVKFDNTDIIYSNPNTTLVTKRISKFLKLSDKFLVAQGFSPEVNNILNAELEIPSDHYYEVNSEGNVVDVVTPEQNIQAALEAVLYIGDKNDSSWQITNNKLERIKFIN